MDDLIGRIFIAVVAASLTMGAVTVPSADSASAPLAASANSASTVATPSTVTSSTASPAAVASQSVLVRLGTLAESPRTADHAAIATRAKTLIASADFVPAPSAVTSWWTLLSDAAHSTLLTEAPGVIGNLDGVPYAVRDAANRSVLVSSIASVREQLPAAGRGMAQILNARLKTLQQVQKALEPTANGPARSLITLDPVAASRAAIAIGDVQTAKYVDFLVPGMYFSVRDQIVDWTNTAAGIQTEQASWLHRFGDSGTSAVISWIGYRTPDIMSVVGLGDAHDGATRLASAVNGLKTARSTDVPFVGVLAHSYGATAALLALKAHDFSADALAMVGTPGSPAQTVSELDVPASQVYVGEAAWDGVATSGFFGTDPTATSYGATALGASGGVDPLTGGTLKAAVGHNGYFASGTESLRNIALIGIDRGTDVTDGSTGDAGVLALSK